MGDAYRLDELRFPQEYSKTSAVGGTTVDCTDFVVPANTIRTILAMSYHVDVGEARWISVLWLGATTHSFRGPISFDSNNGTPLAILEQGMEVRLLPGDRVRIDRSAATAGSSFTIRIRYIDSIIPFQKQFEPQDARKRGSVFFRGGRGGGGGGGGVSGGGAGGSEAGSGFAEGGRTGEPVL